MPVQISIGVGPGYLVMQVAPFNLVTEAGDFLVDESGNSLVWN